MLYHPSLRFSVNMINGLELKSMFCDIEHFKSICFSYLNELSLRYPINFPDPGSEGIVWMLRPIRLDRAPPIIFTRQWPPSAEGTSVYACRCITYIINDTDPSSDNINLLSNLYEEFLACASGIELAETPTSYSYDHTS